jgi:endonuclease/exonuclease/phosphatase family metal-dependent hydrolase
VASVLGVPDGRGIACAFLSRLPFDETANVVDFPQAVRDLHVTDLDGQELTRMGRGAVRVRVTKAGFSCQLIAVHLKSKLLTFPGGAFSTNDETLRAKVAGLALMRRTAEAAAVRIAASKLLAAQSAPGVCVLGDLNDGPEAGTTQIFQGPDGSELGTRGFDRPDEGDPARLWNLAAAIPAARRFSRIHRGQGELLDQILVSEEFMPDGPDGLRRLPLSVDSRIENIQSIGDNPNAVADRPRPDHAPVTAVFDIG